MQAEMQNAGMNETELKNSGNKLVKFAQHILQAITKPTGFPATLTAMTKQKLRQLISCKGGMPNG